MLQLERACARMEVLTTLLLSSLHKALLSYFICGSLSFAVIIPQPHYAHELVKDNCCATGH